MLSAEFFYPACKVLKVNIYKPGPMAFTLKGKATLKDIVL